MAKHTESQINALKNAASKKREGTLERVRTVLEEMEAKDLPITFSAVSAAANVSRDWLYKEADVKNEIQRQRSKATIIQKMLEQKKVIDKKDKEITLLRQRVDSMHDEISGLKKQLEIVYGELYEK